MSEAQVRLAGVGVEFGGTAALQGVDLTISRSEHLVLLGPSGCGKTTILRLIAGLLPPSTGQVTVDGAPPQPGRQAAMVFQSYRLLPWKSAEANIAFALPHLPKEERAARARHYLDLVGLGRFAGAYPATLSGGMRQRLALARALAREPEIFLLDEPFANLDAQSRELMQIELMRLTAARPATVVFVTHSVDEALLLGDRVALMSPRPGRIVEVIDCPFPRPRWQHDPRRDPRFAELREHLWQRLRKMVLTDPGSDFYGRDPYAPLGAD